MKRGECHSYWLVLPIYDTTSAFFRCSRVSTCSKKPPRRGPAQTLRTIEPSFRIQHRLVLLLHGNTRISGEQGCSTALPVVSGVPVSLWASHRLSSWMANQKPFAHNSAINYVNRDRYLTANNHYIRIKGGGFPGWAPTSFFFNDT
jgi:hypothetical protein